MLRSKAGGVPSRPRSATSSRNGKAMRARGDTVNSSFTSTRSAPVKGNTRSRKAAWDSSIHNMSEYRMSNDELREKIQSRRPKSVASYDPALAIAKHKQQIMEQKQREEQNLRGRRAIRPSSAPSVRRTETIDLDREWDAQVMGRASASGASGVRKDGMGTTKGKTAPAKYEGQFIAEAHRELVATLSSLWAGAEQDNPADRSTEEPVNNSEAPWESRGAGNAGVGPMLLATTRAVSFLATQVKELRVDVASERAKREEWEQLAVTQQQLLQDLAAELDSLTQKVAGVHKNVEETAARSSAAARAASESLVARIATLEADRNFVAMSSLMEAVQSPWAPSQPTVRMAAHASVSDAVGERISSTDAQHERDGWEQQQLESSPQAMGLKSGLSPVAEEAADVSEDNDSSHKVAVPTVTFSDGLLARAARVSSSSDGVQASGQGSASRSQLRQSLEKDVAHLADLRARLQQSIQRG